MYQRMLEIFINFFSIFVLLLKVYYTFSVGIIFLYVNSNFRKVTKVLIYYFSMGPYAKIFSFLLYFGIQFGFWYAVDIFLFDNYFLNIYKSFFYDFNTEVAKSTTDPQLQDWKHSNSDLPLHENKISPQTEGVTKENEPFVVSGTFLFALSVIITIISGGMF